MSVEACINPKMVAEDSDDDDTPLIFSRRKPTQLSSVLKNSSPSVRHEKQPLKPSSDIRNNNDRTSSALKGKTASLSKPSSSKPNLGAQKSPPPSSKPLKPLPSSTRPSPSPPTSARPSPSPPSSARAAPSQPPLSSRPSSSLPSSARPSPSPPPSSRPSPSPLPSTSRPSPSVPQSRAPPVKSPSTNGASLGNHQSRKDNHAKEQKRAPIAVKEEKVVKHTSDESDDSDDDKLLSARCSVGLQKGNAEIKPTKSDYVDSDDEKPLSSRMDKGRAVAGASQTQKSKTGSVKSPDDSDDDKPLSSNMRKNNSGTHCKYDDSNEHKPLVSRLQQNGSIKRENQSKVPSNSIKRPSEASVGQPSMKKAKLTASSTSGNVRQIPLKSDVKDDDDHVPIGQRMNKAGSTSKSVPVKKAAKFDSSKLKVNKNSKKIMKQSKYSKSSKELPSSGDGQKWTTLVHHGVIFPPPYKPHGVKMLYDGKPVDLTPEQEEVCPVPFFIFC